jgi:choice-of-anchor B domain-containing protein
MKKSKSFVVAACLVASAAVTTLLAHVDDPKEKDKQPPYTGPGFKLGEGGIAGSPIDFPADNVQLLAWLPVVEFAPEMTSSNTVEGYVSPSGREYAIIGLSHGTGFVEVTDPASPVILEVITGPTSTWRDVRTYLTYAYAVSEGGQGIQVMDISQIDDGVITLVNTVTAPEGSSTSTHTMFINQDSGYLYRAGGSGNGLRIYSLADPANPAFVNAWSDRYTHEVTVVNYTEGKYAGKEIAFACGGFNNGGTQTGLTILDVTDKQNITEFVHYQYPKAAYSHQGWLSEDKQYFYLDDELDDNQFGNFSETRVINISDLSNPFVESTFASGATSIDHNLYVKGNLIYESNYRSGLRIFDATDPLNPVQIAFFDTYPENDNANFNSLWDNYPYLSSGIVLGSDIEKGLFIWHVGPPALQITLPNNAPLLLDPQGDSFLVTITPLASTVAPGTAMLHYDVGDGFVDVPLIDLGSDLYEAVFPTLPCPDEVKFYVSAQAENGSIVRNPPAAPNDTFLATAALAELLEYQDTMDTDTGWTVGAPGDAANTGIWVRVDPNGTGAQPEDDSQTSFGTMCWVTGQGLPGGGLGEADVDGGATTLLSPLLDATRVADPYLIYHRWYSNNMGSTPGTDVFPIWISNDGGGSWTLIENVSENAGAWVRQRVRIADYVAPTSQIRLRFVAQDLGEGSLVEAGVDDVRIVEYDCGGEPPLSPDIDGDGTVGPADLGALLALWGQCDAKGPCAADFDDDGSVGPADLAELLANWGPVKG